MNTAMRQKNQMSHLTDEITKKIQRKKNYVKIIYLIKKIKKII